MVRVLRVDPRPVVVAVLEPDGGRRAIGRPERVRGDEPEIFILSHLHLDKPLGKRVHQVELRRPGRREVAIRRVIGALFVVDPLDELGDDEVQVGIALAVGVGRQVDRHPVDGGRKVSAVIQVEAAKKVLVRLPVAGMLRDDQSRDDLQELAAPQERASVELGGADLALRGGIGLPDEVVFAAVDDDLAEERGGVGLRHRLREGGRTGHPERQGEEECSRSAATIRWKVHGVYSR